MSFSSKIERIFSATGEPPGSLVVIAGMFACCIGVLPAFALGQLLHLALFRALKNEA